MTLMLHRPGVVLELEEVVEAVDAVMGSRTFAAVLVALGITRTWRHGGSRLFMNSNPRDGNSTTVNLTGDRAGTLKVYE